MYKRGAVALLFIILAVILVSAVSEKQVMVREEKSKQAWLGVMIENISEKTLANLNIENGIKISKVYKESPAEQAGLQEEDIMLSFDGKGINDTEKLIDLVQAKAIGDQVEIEILRDGKRERFQVKLAARPERRVMIRGPRSPRHFSFITEDQTWLGVYTLSLSDQLRSYFGVEENLGILIKEVVKDSPAEKAGLKAGDVIVKVAEKKVRDLRDLKRAVNYFEPGDQIDIKVVREKKEKTFKVTLEKRKDKDNIYYYGEGNEFELPEVPDVNIYIPEGELIPDEIIEEELVPKLKEIPEKLEWQMQGLDEKLRDLEEKLKNMQIRIADDENHYI